MGKAERTVMRLRDLGDEEGGSTPPDHPIPNADVGLRHGKGFPLFIGWHVKAGDNV